MRKLRSFAWTCIGFRFSVDLLVLNRLRKLPRVLGPPVDMHYTEP